MTNIQAMAFIESWARDELENRGEGKELEILKFFEEQERKAEINTKDSLYKFMLQLKGNAMDVTFGERDNENTFGPFAANESKSKADILQQLKS